MAGRNIMHVFFWACMFCCTNLYNKYLDSNNITSFLVFDRQLYKKLLGCIYFALIFLYCVHVLPIYKNLDKVDRQTITDLVTSHPCPKRTRSSAINNERQIG